MIPPVSFFLLFGGGGGGGGVSSTDSPSDLSSNIIFSGKPKNLQKKGSFVDTTDPNAPILAPCPAESYCPGGTTLTPISCPSGTGTLGSPGAGSSDQCVPQDPCVPDPNTCCSGPITQPGWPFYGPYLCSGVGGLCTNTAVDKNVSQRRGGGGGWAFIVLFWTHLDAEEDDSSLFSSLFSPVVFPRIHPIHSELRLLRRRM